MPRPPAFLVALCHLAPHAQVLDEGSSMASPSDPASPERAEDKLT
jgi:hypothetical protein